MAKTKPQTQQVTTIKDWTEADQNLKFIGLIEQKIKALSAKMNQEIVRVQDKYNPELDVLEQEKIGLERNLQLFCEDKRSEFNDKKSKDLSFGIVSFRLSTPALKQLKGFTWENIKILLQKSKKYAEQFIKVKTDLNKQAILGAGLSETELAKYGMQISQEENFYYECHERE